MNKWLMAMLAVILVVPTWATPRVGIQLGSDNGVTVHAQGWDVGVSVERFAVSVDRRIPSNLNPALYFGVGGMISDTDDEEIGLRVKAGVATQIDQLELFAELVPVFYPGKDLEMDLDYSLGLRIRF
ncbi:hypothetical protein SAMN04488540_11046 [Ferrimonas sediminum]|uniref:Outer membrane protein beta-barrel domain-containing protein n=1 Tax=Ferrimonas sediminum TaxID=718193 RepID=A0A1G8UZ36_9GAMM|nr:hypothetical protein [Ferrimonas sediminum]SDJ59116.1 hypothetical protein SAMN04488540_11046 [Ferrimonas sediminum]